MLAYELDIDKIGASRGLHGFGIFVKSGLGNMDDPVERPSTFTGTPPCTFYRQEYRQLGVHGMHGTGNAPENL